MSQPNLRVRVVGLEYLVRYMSLSQLVEAVDTFLQYFKINVPSKTVLKVWLTNDLPLSALDEVTFNGPTESKGERETLGWFYFSRKGQPIINLKVNNRLPRSSLQVTITHELDHWRWALEGRRFCDDPPYDERDHEIRARHVASLLTPVIFGPQLPDHMALGRVVRCHVNAPPLVVELERVIEGIF